MVRRKRNYKLEYQRRVARGLTKGFSRSQARGHRKPNEALASTQRAERAIEDAKLQFGLRLLRKGENLSSVAKNIRISRERLRSYAIDKGLIERRGRRWVVKHKLPRRVLIYSDKREKIVTVGDFKEASLVGKYMSAVGHFLKSNDRAHLKPFVGKSVTDIKQKSHRLETGPNTLYRLSHTGGSTFEQVYRIVI